MSIEENSNKVGYGSWHSTQSYRDYKDFMSFEDYEKHIYDMCVKRICSLGLQEGDIIRFDYIGGHKPRKVTGEFVHANCMLHIQQKSREVSYHITLIDEIDILDRVDKKKVVNMFDYKKNLH